MLNLGGVDQLWDSIALRLSTMRSSPRKCKVKHVSRRKRLIAELEINSASSISSMTLRLLFLITTPACHSCYSPLLLSTFLLARNLLEYL